MSKSIENYKIVVNVYKFKRGPGQNSKCVVLLHNFTTPLISV